MAMQEVKKAKFKKYDIVRSKAKVKMVDKYLTYYITEYDSQMDNYRYCDLDGNCLRLSRDLMERWYKKIGEIEK